MKKILVTGGAGFIGSHLCERLRRDGHEVISLDNYFAGTKANHIDGVEYREGHTKDIEKLIPETVDIVYHLGEYSRVERSLEEEPSLVWDLNIAGTFAVLEYCRKKKVKIVYAGSSTKFGDGGLARDATPYAWTKSSNTELVKNYSTWYGLDYSITYFYNVYGPRERGHGAHSTVIGRFSEWFLKGEPLKINSPGTQTRNYTFISDIIDGLVLIGDKGTREEYGLGSEKAYSVLELAKFFKSPVTMLPPPKGNRQTNWLDTSKARELGWSPKIELVEGLQKTLDYFRTQVSK